MTGTGPYAELPYGSAALGLAPTPPWAMAGATKRTAIVAEAVQGTTPAAPAFKVLRDISVANEVTRSDTFSPERRPDRATAAVTTGLASFQKTIELPFVRDDGVDILWESALCSAFSGDTIMNGSTRRPFTLEETYNAEDGAYRRLTGCVVDEAAIALSSNDIGALRFKVRGITEGVGPDPLAGATYAAPSPGHDPVTGVSITVTNLFSITTPRVVALSLMMRNNTADKHAFGSANPAGTRMGQFQVVGQADLYFTRIDDYRTFMTRQPGRGLDLTVGCVGGARDQLQLFNVDVWNPAVDDPGSAGDHMITLNFIAKYSAANSGVLALTRNV